MTETLVTSKPDETQMTLSQLLTALEETENSLEEFDPATIIGSLNDKIDSIHLVLEKMKATRDHMKELAKPFTAKARVMDNSYERLREYIAFEMKTKGFDTLPGKSYKATLAYGKEKVVIQSEREPTAHDVKAMKRFITTNVSFEWNEDEIEKAFLAGEELPTILSAHTTQSSWVLFKPFVPEVLEKKARAKK